MRKRIKLFKWLSLPRKFVVIGLPAGFAVTACSVVALGVTGSLQGFSASISNSSGAYQAGTLLLSETQGANTCLSTATGSAITTANTGTCTTINLLGSQTNATPGIAASSTSVTVKNTGSVSASALTLNPGTCAVTSPTNNAYTPTGSSQTATFNGSDTSGFCGKVDVTIGTSTACLYPVSSSPCAAPTSSNTLATLSSSSITLGALASGVSNTYTFTLQLDSSATNADQGLAATDTFAWNLVQ